VGSPWWLRKAGSGAFWNMDEVNMLQVLVRPKHDSGFSWSWVICTFKIGSGGGEIGKERGETNE
jgi:hypothetical protein